MSSSTKHTGEAQTSSNLTDTDSTSSPRMARPQVKSTAPLPASGTADVAPVSAANGRNSPSSTTGNGRTSRLSTAELIAKAKQQISRVQTRLAEDNKLYKSSTLPASQQNFTPPLDSATTSGNIIPASDPLAKLREKIAQAAEMQAALKAKEAVRKQQLAEERIAKAAKAEHYKRSRDTLGQLGRFQRSDSTERLTGPDRFISKPNAFTGTPLAEKNPNARLNRKSSKDTSKQQQKAAPTGNKKRRRDTEADDETPEREYKKTKSSVSNIKASTLPSTDPKIHMASQKQPEAAQNINPDRATSKRGSSLKSQRPVSKAPALQTNGQKVDLAEAARKVSQKKRARSDDEDEDEQDRPTTKKAKLDAASELSDKEEDEHAQIDDSQHMRSNEDDTNEADEQHQPKEGGAVSKTAQLDTVMTDDDGDAPSKPTRKGVAVNPNKPKNKPKKAKTATRSQIRSKFIAGG